MLLFPNDMAHNATFFPQSFTTKDAHDVSDEDLLIERFFDDDLMTPDVFGLDASPTFPANPASMLPEPQADHLVRTHSNDHQQASSTGDEYVPDEEDEEEDAPARKKRAPAPKAPSKQRARRGTRTPEERAQAVLEKNRRAQKRFRERSKQRAKEVEDTLQSLTEQVEKLTVENSSMSARTAMLEKVVALRDEQIQQMQEEQKVFAFTHGMPAQITSPGCMPKEMQLLPAGMVPSQPTTRSYDNFFTEYKSLVSAMIPLLAEHDMADDADKKRSVAQRLQTIATDAGCLCMMEAMRNPNNVKRLMAEEGQHPTSKRSNQPSFWVDTVASLELTPQQVTEVQRLRAVFVAKAEALLAERRQLSEELRANSAADTSGNELRAMAGQVVRVHEVSKALTANLAQEHTAAMDFAALLFKKTLRPLALARVLVASFPVFPDALALSTAVVQGA